MHIKNQKDFAAGLSFVAIGIAFAIGATEHTLRNGAHMGPGYFPLMMGIILAILGVLIAANAFGSDEEPVQKFGPVAWRPLFFIIAANVLFGALLGGVPALNIPSMGLIVAIFALTFVAMLGGRHFSLKSALVLSTILAAGSYLVFVYALSLTIQVWPAFITQ